MTDYAMKICYVNDPVVAAVGSSMAGVEIGCLRVFGFLEGSAGQHYRKVASLSLVYLEGPIDMWMRGIL